MLNRTKLSLSSLAIIALIGAALGAPSVAIAQTATTAKAAEKPVEKAEARIKEMHAKLKITPAQDPQWQDFVTAQRDSAEQMSQLIEQRDQSSSAMNAVDDFKNYEQIVEAHADGLKKVVPAFEKLYDSLSDQQKKMADSMFRGAAGRKAS
jgi:Spy/CpxP family protein refolding chaperone